jgi:hypothetical protein
MPYKHCDRASLCMNARPSWTIKTSGSSKVKALNSNSFVSPLPFFFIEFPPALPSRPDHHVLKINRRLCRPQHRSVLHARAQYPFVCQSSGTAPRPHRRRPRQELDRPTGTYCTSTFITGQVDKAPQFVFDFFSPPAGVVTGAAGHTVAATSGTFPAVVGNGVAMSVSLSYSLVRKL